MPLFHFEHFSAFAFVLESCFELFVAGMTDAVLAKALIPRWLVVERKFTVLDMRRHQSLFASTVCYPAVGDLVCPSKPPVGQDSKGWLWVTFRVPCIPTGKREGYIHPGIVFGNL